jgi:plasmid stabilization system protein ParE
MRRVIWTEEARDNLVAIRAYVEQFNPGAARRLARRLVEHTESLDTMPDRGRPLRPGVRDLTGIPPYLVRYAVTDDVVRILSIRHSARRPLP